MRGFAYCNDTVFKVEEMRGGFYGTLPCEINGKDINEELQSWLEGPDLVFERDEIIVLPRRYQIGNILGGIGLLRLSHSTSALGQRLPWPA
ncbi:hypothetical protein XH83_27155 [Bradyrhizobium sp. CCBAU 53351]|nr:hypothetical protein XH83_27155 [Bradyrhizobium sp. CCBAU 53351]